MRVLRMKNSYSDLKVPIDKWYDSGKDLSFFNFLSDNRN